MSEKVMAPSSPARFRAGEARNARLGRPLRILGRVKQVDEALLERIGRAMFERDELGARLAEAIRLRAGSPGRVTMDQFRRALEHGIATVPDAPPALAAFFAEVEAEPAWLDRARVEEGGRFFRRLGQNAADVLLQLSLVGGYRFGGPTDLLVATGGLTGQQTLRRLAETQKWASSLSDPGALLPPRDGRPSGTGWRLTVHVRLMHALVNHSFEHTWDCERWGLPINQADEASTLGLFDGVLIIGARSLGVHPDFLVDDEWERHRINYHVLLAQGELTDAGPQLARAVVQAQALRTYSGWPRVLQPLRARYERERLLSMLTVFLGLTSMRELGLPARPPWAFGYIVPLNTLRYRVLGRTAAGRRWLLEWGDRRDQEILDSYFGGDAEDVGELRV